MVWESWVGRGRVRPDRIVAHLAAGLGAIGATYLVGGAEGFVVTSMAPRFLWLLPDELVIWGVLTIGGLGKPLLLLAMGIGCLLAYGAVAAIGTLIVARLEWPAIAVVPVVGAGHLLATSLVLGAGISAIAAGVVGGLLVAVARPSHTGHEGIPGRRRLLVAVGTALGTFGAGLVLEHVGGRATGPVDDQGEPVDPLVGELLDVAEDRSLDLEGAEPLVSTSFYTVDISPTTPRLDRDRWRLSVRGRVTRELDLGIEDLREGSVEHRFVTLRCVSDDVDGRLMDTALWTGVPMRTVLEAAGSPEDCCVRLDAADGYFQGFPRAVLDEGFLAWEMNGKPLPPAHGHPVRLLIPGHWGEINVKWLTDVEVLDEPEVGYWERRGWQGTGQVETVAKLESVSRTADGRIRVGGHAYAGTRGIRRVEVSTDVARTWSTATLSDPLPGATPADGGLVSAGEAADAWRMWSFEYPAEGGHLLTVRAVDGTGAVQSGEETGPFPSGATGWVRRHIRPESL